VEFFSCGERPFILAFESSVVVEAGEILSAFMPKDKERFVQVDCGM
jgi:hypothetical protein